MTIKKTKILNLDNASKLESCQGFVMLGRNQAVDQFFISKPWGSKPPEIWLTNHIYTSDRALTQT